MTIQVISKALLEKKRPTASVKEMRDATGKVREFNLRDHMSPVGGGRGDCGGIHRQ